MNEYMHEQELTMLIKKLDLDSVTTMDRKRTSGESRTKSGTGADECGTIEIADQTIRIQDPDDGQGYPVIRPIAPVRLYINGKEVHGEAPVSATDTVTWEIEERPMFDVVVSEDKLQAFLHLNATERFAWKLEDSEPAAVVELRAVEDKETVLETLHFSDVIMYLEQKSIKSNLDIAAIQQELTEPTYSPVLIARGKASVPGQDATLEIYFPEQVENQFFEINGAIDFRNHMQIPSVTKGDKIAKKYPMQQGMPGYDVHGDVLVPPAPKDMIVVAKSGVEITSEGEVIALKDGRPRLSGGKIKTFDISTAFIVSGNVDIATGNIVFSGDVVVYGDVTDNMIVESLGNVYVYGHVYNATITATGSIHVRGVVMGSKLYSGYFGVMFNRLYQTSKWLNEILEHLYQASQLLAKTLEQRKQPFRFGQILLLLIENKFKDIPLKIRDLLSVITSIQHLKKEEFQKLKDRATVFLQPHLLVETATSSFIQGFISMLKDAYLEVARMQEEQAKTIFNQCNNSELKSNGDIIVLRDGVLQSDLYSAGNIEFRSPQAVCRGSKLEAKHSIEAKIVGGQSGAAMLLKAGKSVYVSKMYAGRVCIGKVCTDIMEPIEDRYFTASAWEKQRANGNSE